MRVLFHTNTLNFRGTTVAVTDYAKYNQDILGNESIIAYNASLGYEKDMGSEQFVVDELKKQFNVVGYKEGDLPGIIDKEKVDFAYFIRAGNKEPLPNNTKTGIHSVFQYYEPHGDKYAYISKWLSDTMSGSTAPYVPHIVNLPEPTGDYRTAFGIDKDKIVLGRYGGYYTFDIPQVKNYIGELVNRDSRFVFLFVGTEPFIDHPQVKFINEFHSLQKKSNFINTCDGMIHARQRGESFGLSIAEFLYFNKPVFAWNNGHDKNHIEMLGASGTLYKDTESLDNILYNFNELKDQDWRGKVKNYTPEEVMNKFNETFLK